MSGLWLRCGEEDWNCVEISFFDWRRVERKFVGKVEWEKWRKSGYLTSAAVRTCASPDESSEHADHVTTCDVLSFRRHAVSP